MAAGTIELRPARGRSAARKTMSAGMSANLLQRIAAGETAAVGEFLARHTSAVWNLARRYCRSAEDSEDATQEIFLDAWKSAHRYDPAVGSETTFLMTIARRRLIDRARRNGRRPATEMYPAADELADDAQPTPAVHAETVDEVARAREALNELRPEQRQVLELSLTQGCSHQEIADDTGMPLGTVKSHARRGLIRLREILSVRRPSDLQPMLAKPDPRLANPQLERGRP